MPAHLPVCPDCGAAAEGAFCARCGQSLTPAACPHCQVTVRPEARFCHRCGEPLAMQSARSGGDRLPWIVAGACTVGLVALVLFKVMRDAPAPVVPQMGNVGAPSAGIGSAATTDISQMTPRERFDRLFDRLMRAGAEGDSITIVNFSPMALGAYAQLDSTEIDADARFHAALVSIQIGDFAGALALADTMERRDPTHLFVPVLRGTIAGLSGDTTARNRQFAAFLRHFDAETARKDRPEYLDHPQLMTEFKKEAENH